MTDNEIIKALERCRSNEKEGTCEYCLSCPMAHCDLDEDEELNCLDAVYKRALDLIKRQKAEIERLEKEQNTFAKRFYKDGIKDFAESLKEKAYLDGAVSITQELVVDVRDIDTLVEEMTVNYESSTNDKQRKDEGNERYNF